MCQEVNYESYKTMVESKETFILDLYLENCAPCQQMMPTIHTLAIPGVKIVKMDILKNRRIYHELSLKTAPTLIYYHEGTEINRLVGYQDPTSITSMVA
jgi:thioredoxin 1